MMFALFVGSIIFTLHLPSGGLASRVYWIHVVYRQDDIQPYITYLINLRAVYIRVSNRRRSLTLHLRSGEIRRRGTLGPCFEPASRLSAPLRLRRCGLRFRA